MIELDDIGLCRSLFDEHRLQATETKYSHLLDLLTRHLVRDIFLVILASPLLQIRRHLQLPNRFVRLLSSSLVFCLAVVLDWLKDRCGRIESAKEIHSATKVVVVLWDSYALKIKNDLFCGEGLTVSNSRPANLDITTLTRSLAQFPIPNHSVRLKPFDGTIDEPVQGAEVSRSTRLNKVIL